MNYYEHHIGDYAEATAHLSFVEDAAYSRLIRKYYASEKPLPVEIKAVQRLIAARTKEEKEAVETILDEFFDLRSDGWHNERCDEEIARFQDKQAKAKRSADARWSKSKTHSEGNANASPNAMRTHSEGNALQSPVTSHQSPDVNPSKQSSSHSQPLGVTTFPNDRPEIPDPPTTEAHWLTWLNREAGTQFEAGSRFDRKDLWPIFRRWCESGITQRQVMDAIRAAQANAREPIANLPKYIDRVLANSQAPAKTSPADSAKLAAARAIFGTEIEGDNHGQSARVIDVERTTPALRG